MFITPFFSHFTANRDASDAGKTMTLWHVVEGASLAEVFMVPKHEIAQTAATAYRRSRLKAGSNSSKSGETWYRGHCTVLLCRTCVAVLWRFGDCSIDSI